MSNAADRGNSNDLPDTLKSQPPAQYGQQQQPNVYPSSPYDISHMNQNTPSGSFDPRPFSGLQDTKSKEPRHPGQGIQKQSPPKSYLSSPYYTAYMNQNSTPGMTALRPLSEIQNPQNNKPLQPSQDDQQKTLNNPYPYGHPYYSSPYYPNSYYPPYGSQYSATRFADQQKSDEPIDRPRNNPPSKDGLPKPPDVSYPYGHPYYSSPYYASFMNQYPAPGYANQRTSDESIDKLGKNVPLQNGPQQPLYGSYPYSNPYYSNPYYNPYMTPALPPKGLADQLKPSTPLGRPGGYYSPGHPYYSSSYYAAYVKQYPGPILPNFRSAEPQIREASRINGAGGTYKILPEEESLRRPSEEETQRANNTGAKPNKWKNSRFPGRVESSQSVALDVSIPTRTESSSHPIHSGLENDLELGALQESTGNLQSRTEISNNIQKLPQIAKKDWKSRRVRNSEQEAELIEFAKTFKLQTPMPEDLAQIIFKDDEKRKNKLQEWDDDFPSLSSGKEKKAPQDQQPLDYTKLLIDKTAESPITKSHVETETITQVAVPLPMAQPVAESPHPARNVTPSIFGTGSSAPTRASTFRTKTSLGPLSTAATSIPDSQSPLKSSKVKERLSQEIATERNHLLSIEEEPDAPNQYTQSLSDGHSSISRLTFLDSKQRNDITRRFVDAVCKALPSAGSRQYDRVTLALQEHFPALLKNYSKRITADTGPGPRRQAAKQIRSLRFRISEQFEDELVGHGPISKEKRVYPKIVEDAIKVTPPQQNWAEKVADWKMEPLLNETLWENQLDDDHQPELETLLELKIPSEPTSQPASWSDFDRADSGTESETAEIIHTTPGEDKKIYDFLTSHNAFKDLVGDIQELIDHHYSNSMEVIKHRILLGLRRPDDTATATSKSVIQTIALSLDWDLVSFLRGQYKHGLAQDLGAILTITGRVTDAYMSTVRDYLQETWPTHPLTLLEALQEALLNYPQDETSGIVLSCAAGRGIIVNLLENTLLVTGSEDFIVRIAQQAAWLVSVCRVSPLGVEYSAVSCHAEALNCHLPLTAFRISSEVSPSPLNEPGSCWNEVVGNTIISNGFPIPKRHNNERGLELPLEVMAGLGGVALITEYSGGILLKGRSIAFVPVERSGSSVQWHVVQKLGARIKYSDVAQLCPTRLGVDILSQDDLPKTKTFLGWCSNTINLLGTEFANYKGIGISNTKPRSKRFLALSSFTLGFSETATGEAGFKFGKHNGSYTAEQSMYYSQILNDAKEFHVILHDMEQRRGWQTDGERAILHMILHRQALDEYKMNGKAVQFQVADCKTPSSVRLAMIANADTVVMLDHLMNSNELASQSFKNLVGDLYARLEGMQDTIQEESTDGIELTRHWKKRVLGYEYMDLIRRKRKMIIRTAELRKTCGDWPDYARDVGALLLFGTNFGEAFQPFESASLCSSFKSVPKDNDFLSVEVATLKLLYTENGCEKTQDRITPNGTQWLRSTHVFEPCPAGTLADNGLCHCERIQKFGSKSILGSSKGPSPLGDSGAVIFGQALSRLHKDPPKKLLGTLNSQKREHQKEVLQDRASSSALVELQDIVAESSSQLRYHHEQDDSDSTTTSEFNYQDKTLSNSSRPGLDLHPSHLAFGYKSQTSSTINSTSSTGRSSNVTSADLEYLTPVSSHDARSEDEHIKPSSISDFTNRDNSRKLYSDALKHMATTINSDVVDTTRPAVSRVSQRDYRSIPRRSRQYENTIYENPRSSMAVDPGQSLDRLAHLKFTRPPLQRDCQVEHTETGKSSPDEAMYRGKRAERPANPLYFGSLQMQQVQNPLLDARNVSRSTTSPNSWSLVPKTLPHNDCKGHQRNIPSTNESTLIQQLDEAPDKGKLIGRSTHPHYNPGSRPQAQPWSTARTFSEVLTESPRPISVGRVSPTLRRKPTFQNASILRRDTFGR